MLRITTLHNSMSISSRGFAFGFPKMARTNEDVFLTYKPMINTLISQRETPFQQSSTFSRSSLFLTEYMVQQLGIEKDGVAEMNQFLYRNYGTSMAGLKVQSLNEFMHIYTNPVDICFKVSNFLCCFLGYWL